MPDFVKVDAIDVLAKFAGMRTKDVPFLTAYTLTKTAKDVLDAERAKMVDVFDRPKEWTLNSLVMKSASKDEAEPSAIVYFRPGFGSTPAWRYLSPQVEGGARAHKSHEKRLISAGLMHAGEFAVPGPGIKTDAYGNIPGSVIELILSQVEAAEQWAGYQANATKRSLKRRRRQGLGRYFYLRSDAAHAKARRAVRPGIYYREGARDMVPVILFVASPRYQKRFPFHEVAKSTTDRVLWKHAQAGFDKYVLPKMMKALT
jgi:hypothetical protein